MVHFWQLRQALLRRVCKGGEKIDKKNALKILVILMMLFTIAWLCLTGWAIYNEKVSEANEDYSPPKQMGIAAEKLDSEPSQWKTPEELGIMLAQYGKWVLAYAVNANWKNWVSSDTLPNVKNQSEFYRLVKLKEPIAFGIYKIFVAEKTTLNNTLSDIRTAEQLGIVPVPLELGNDTLLYLYIEDESKALPWINNEEYHFFTLECNGNFYMIAPFNVTPGLDIGNSILSHQVQVWVTISTGYIILGVLYFQEKSNNFDKLTYLTSFSRCVMNIRFMVKILILSLLM